MSMTFSGYTVDGNRFNCVEVEMEDINLCNTNARDVSRSLGMNIDATYGDVEPMQIGEFINRCTNFLRARMGHLDPGIPPSEEQDEAGPSVVFFGREEGYLTNRVALIKRHAVLCRDAGAEVYGPV